MRTRSGFSTVCLLILLVGCLPVPTWGQQIQGSITGVVTDPSGSLIPDAQVTAVEQRTGFSRSSQTRQDGSYDIPLLPPGQYLVEVAMSGFETLSQGPITLLVNAHLKMDFHMKVGAQTTTVSVSAAATVIDTQTSSVGTTVGEQEVQQLPLNGRHFLELTFLTPGVVPAAGGSENSTRGGGINVNGLRESMNNYLLDGMTNTSFGVGQYVVTPPVDSIQEFRMETGMYDARFGGQAGAQVNMVTKSGTNQLHGSLYDFLRNKVLDARNYFEPVVPPFVRNQFGASLGGPIVVPRLYNGHDRTFFFAAYEGLLERRSFFTQFRVPTMAERGGDFTDLTGPDCSAPTVLLNPLALLSTGSVQPFTNINQVLPAADPVGQALVDLYPQPNIQGAKCGDVNYIAEGNRKINLDTYTFRLDHSWGTKNTVFFRFSQTLDHTFLPFGEGGQLPGYGRLDRDGFLMAGLDWTHTFTPHLLNEAKFAYNRWRLRFDNEDQGRLVAQGLGIQGVSTVFRQTGVPNLTMGAYPGIGAGTNVPQSGAVNTFELADTLTQIHGNHSFAYGADILMVKRGNFYIDETIRGEFDFTGLVTGGLGSVTPDQLGLPSNTILGNGVADALLGLPTDWINGFSAYISASMTSYNYFVQDNWKVRPNLTLNLGLRYEYNSLVTDKYNHFSNFDFSNGLLMVAGTNAVTLMNFDTSTGLYVTAGTINLGTTAENRSLQYPDRNNWAPRLGFSWQPWQKTVVRGGGGIFYDRTFGDVDFQKVGPPYTKVNLGTLTGAVPAIMSGALSVGTGAIIQNAFEPNLVSPFFPSVNPFNLHFRDAFIPQWTLDLQRELPGSVLLDVGYVGTRGLRLVREWDPNQPVHDPVTQQMVRPYPAYSNFSYTDSSGNSIYHSLQLKLEKHYSHRLALIGSYTFSKSLDTNSTVFGTNRNTNFPQDSHNLAAEKGRSDFDIRHRFVMGYVYDLPFGDSVAKLQNSSLNYLIRDWELSGMIVAQSGPPFTPQISGDISQTQEGNDRPNLVGNPYPAAQGPNQWVLASAFATPAPYTFGNAGRNILTGPGLASCDFSVIRSFQLKESKLLEFRAEIFNLFNRANFDVPQADVASPSFGKIFNTVQSVAGFASGGPGDPRLVQFALKFKF